MIKIIHISLIIIFFIFSSCEDIEREKTITITYPNNGEIIYEIVTINVDISDTEEIGMIEMIVNGLATGVIDTIAPFSLEWNTSFVNDGEYTIQVLAYYLNGDTLDSQPIVLEVLNEESRPDSVTITSLSYEDGIFLIDWSQNDDDDFHSYTLFESSYEDMTNAYDIMSTEFQTRTSYSFSREMTIKYYQVVVQDHPGLKSYSNIEKGNSYTRFRREFNQSHQNLGIYGLETSDGGYISIGTTQSNGFDENWIIKLDSKGEEEWISNLGKEAKFFTTGSIQEAIDGGFVMVGGDNWLMKTDGQGQEEWFNSYGNDLYNKMLFSIDHTIDGGYIITGQTSLTSSLVDCRVWLIKTDSQGQEEWSRVIGDSAGTSYGTSVKQIDDGYIISGHYAENFPNNAAYLIKTDLLGHVVWEKIYYQYWYIAYDVNQTIDGGYIFSANKLSEFSLQKVNSTGEEEWSIDYHDIQSFNLTSDYGYIITTSHQENETDYIKLIKTNSEGQEEWSQHINGTRGSAVEQVSDGGYFITGHISETGNGSSNLLMIKTDSRGGID